MVLAVLSTVLALVCAVLAWRLWRAQAAGTAPLAEDLRLGRLLREAIECLPEGFVLFDPDDRLLLCNDELRDMHPISAKSFQAGVRFEDILRRGIADREYPQAVGREDAWLAERLAQHRQGNAAVEQEIADGRWLRICERRTESGHRVGIYSNITALKEREKELILAERGLSEILEAMGEGFALLDDQDRLIMWNKRYEEMFPLISDLITYGATVEELMRAAAERGQVEGAKENTEAWVQERLKAYRALDSGSEIQFKSNRWVLTRKYRGAHGRTLALFLDITELKRREAELRDAKLQAETANRIKSEFLANMSHELRTPLNAIIGFSDIMIKEQAGPIGTPVYREYARDVNDSGHQLLGFIEDLIDLSRLETGQIDLHETEIDVGGLLDLCRRAFEDRAASAEVSLAVEPGAAQIEIWADQVRLRQVLHNLISNAIKFTPSGGGVRLSGRVEVSGEILIAVSDTGIGMTPHELDIAMEPFRQAQSSLTRTRGGSGIGLTLCNSMIKLHGGALEIESRKGEGTTVTLRLPAGRRLLRPEASPRAAS
ncbi:MAG: PAS-domain containing protein [Kiloniellales bacterium]|nr:PAS-domain containing protein [Kiloniellales bacterium]